MKKIILTCISKKIVPQPPKHVQNVKRVQTRPRKVWHFKKKKSERTTVPPKFLIIFLFLLQSDLWLSLARRRLRLPAARLCLASHCSGHLLKLDGRSKTWKRRFCVLCDGCLYLYASAESQRAIGERRGGLEGRKKKNTSENVDENLWNLE